MTAFDGPLHGIRVLDLSRNGPGPYASMLLADLGAQVIAVQGGRAGQAVADVARGKRMINLDLKSDSGLAAFRHLASRSDVVLDGFRPGVLDRLGAGYTELAGANAGLVFCALTGYGQSGPLRERAGHDINYLALSGVLGALGPTDGPPLPPLNLIADFAGGSMLAVIGIQAALLRRATTGRGTFIDSAMVDGVMSMMACWYPAWGTNVLPGRGVGLTTGVAPFYRCYECSDGRFVAVGAFEPQFFAALWRLLDFADSVPNHFDPSTWPGLTDRIAARIRERTRDEWAALAAPVDACLSPVLAPDEVWANEHNRARHPNSGPTRVPVIPAMSDWSPEPGEADLTDSTKSVLEEVGCPSELIERVLEGGAGPHRDAGVQWPPF